MYRTLVDAGIPTSTHMVVDREGLEAGQDPEGFIEDDDFVELDGLKIKKPFVEKPFDGELGIPVSWVPWEGGGLAVVQAGRLGQA